MQSRGEKILKLLQSSKQIGNPITQNNTTSTVTNLQVRNDFPSTCSGSKNGGSTMNDKQGLVDKNSQSLVTLTGIATSTNDTLAINCPNMDIHLGIYNIDDNGVETNLTCTESAQEDQQQVEIDLEGCLTHPVQEIDENCKVSLDQFYHLDKGNIELEVLQQCQQVEVDIELGINKTDQQVDIDLGLALEDNEEVESCEVTEQCQVVHNNFDLVLAYEVNKEADNFDLIEQDQVVYNNFDLGLAQEDIYVTENVVVTGDFQEIEAAHGLRNENILCLPEEHPDIPTENGKTKKSRKRKADPDSWERNVRKKSRMSGKSYTTRKGVVVPEKTFIAVEHCGCRFQCETKISTEQQNCLFQEYWNMADSCYQKVFISKLVEELPIARHRIRNGDSNKTKNKSRFYYLRNTDREKHRVCLKFFCRIFQISFQVIDRALRKSSSSGAYVGIDGRKGRRAPNKTKPEVADHVRKHIDSFPRMESHYCRKHTKKLYLSSELNVSELYRLYVRDYCHEQNINPVKEQIYRSIFKSYDPPLATYIPKKDQCTKCNQYNNAQDKSLFEEEHNVHYRRKSEAMDMKRKDMEAKVDNRVTITFDLQAVLSVPFAGDCQIYYKRKLLVYNFTVFDSNANGFCYLWDECNGMKGSCEIGTGLASYMNNLPQNVTHVITYSDTCGGQNRNQYISALLLYIVNKTNVETIDMKFMEPGHTYLEADSMHATIERARKHKKVYTTREWGLLIEMARKKPKPYVVKVLDYSDILDLTELGKNVMTNRTIDSEGAVVNWLKIKWLRFEKSKPYTIRFKYELQAELPFKKLDVSLNRDEPLSWDSITISPKYSSVIPISKAKKKDLLSLLKTGVIPNCYADFIRNIPSSEEARDIVPYRVDNEDDDPMPRKINRRTSMQPICMTINTRNRLNEKKKETEGEKNRKEISGLNEEKKEAKAKNTHQEGKTIKMPRKTIKKEKAVRKK